MTLAPHRPPTQPVAWAARDERAYAGGLIKRHRRYGDTFVGVVPCPRCGEVWRYWFGGCLAGWLWRCLGCGAVGKAR
jgi:hypothetical protein